MRAIRLVLVLDLLGAAAAAAAILIVLGTPTAAHAGVGAGHFVAAVLLGAALFVAIGSALLTRAVARPLGRILESAARLGTGAEGLPLLAGEEAAGLSRLAVAFERTAAALGDERARVAAKIAELEETNRALATAQESLLRSERLATVGRIASGIAHEVGNPLGAITGYAELARARAGADAVAADYLERIAAEVQRIDRLVRDLLDLARPIPAAATAAAVPTAVETARRLAAVSPRARELAIVADLPAALPPVRASELALGQVILNLFLNAADATGGKGEVRLSAAVAPDALTLTVADDGPGIAPADLPHVFDPFFTTKEPGKGSGLGLAICQRLVESWGGRIAAANGPGGGAVFTVTLPRGEGGAAEAPC